MTTPTRSGVSTPKFTWKEDEVQKLRDKMSSDEISNQLYFDLNIDGLLDQIPDAYRMIDTWIEQAYNNGWREGRKAAIEF